MKLLRYTTQHHLTDRYLTLLHKYLATSDNQYMLDEIEIELQFLYSEIIETMKLIIIFGPQAVGKMTVGHELEKTTYLKLFHNHMTIEFVSPFFSYSSKQGKRLVNLFRKEIFEEVAKSDLEGLIFTYVWDFDQKSNWDYIDNLCKIFESKGGEVCLVELESDFNERIERNKHPHRLIHKPTKRNLERSEKSLIDSMKKHRLNSKNGEIKRKNYVRINNTNLSPEKTAQKIKEKFQL